VDPLPEPLVLRKSGSTGNQTRDLWICRQELWPLDFRGGPFQLTVQPYSPEDGTVRNPAVWMSGPVDIQQVVRKHEHTFRVTVKTHFELGLVFDKITEFLKKSNSFLGGGCDIMKRNELWSSVPEQFRDHSHWYIYIYNFYKVTISNRTAVTLYVILLDFIKLRGHSRRTALANSRY
jgi:hypothetical protein